MMMNYPLCSGRRSLRLKFKVPPHKKTATTKKTAITTKKNLTTTKKNLTTTKKTAPTANKKTTKKAVSTKKAVATTKKAAVTKKANEPSPVVGAEMKNMSDEEMLQHLKTLERLGTFDVQDTSAALVDPMACMKQHEKLKCAVIDNFCACLATYGIKWQALLKNVPFQISNGTRTKVPLIFVVCSGPKTNTKIGIANKALINWNLVTKKKVRKTGCEWYKPVTQNQRVRTFFGEVSRRYGWKLKRKDFQYRSMLDSVLERVYKLRQSQFKAILYGVPNQKRRLTKLEVLLID